MIRPSSPQIPRPTIPLLLLILALIPLGWLEATAPTSPPPELQFSHDSGYYQDAFLLELSGSGTIWFTLDGRIPLPNTATRYTAPIPLNAGQPQVIVVRARLQTADQQLGPVISHSYFLNIPIQLPLLSLIADPDDLWGAERGIITHYEERGRDWERPVDVTFVDSHQQISFHVPAGVRVHGRGSRPLEKKSFRLYFRNDYGLSRLVYPLFEGNIEQSFKRLVLHNGGQDSIQPGLPWTLIRNQIAASLAHNIGANATRSRPAILFVNGQFWGIYQIRERIDQFFLDDQYGIETADLLDTPEELIRTDHVSLGSRDHWDSMMDFALTHDLSDPTYYAHIASQIDITNYIDYNLLQIYSANDDWPHHNMSLFRPQTIGGRWQWFFWDNDRSFAFGLTSPVGKNMIDHVQMNVPTATGRQVTLLQKLLANAEFRNAFLVRMAMLLNTDLAPEAVLAELDALAAAIAPAISYEVGHWPTDGDSWIANVEAIRDFVRRRPDFVRQHAVQGLDLSGTAVLRFAPHPNGDVYLEDRLLTTAWAGQFFQGTTVRVTAVPQPGYQFTSWQEINGPATLNLAVLEDQTLTPRFAPLPEAAPHIGDVLITAVTPTAIQLQTIRSLDLRGWRLTDNDSLTATDEGSLIFTDDPALAQVAAHTTLHIDLTALPRLPDVTFAGDATLIDGTMVLSEANGRLDFDTDPWFHLQQHDILVLLAPGDTAEFIDDQAIAMTAISTDNSLYPIIVGSDLLAYPLMQP